MSRSENAKMLNYVNEKKGKCVDAKKKIQYILIDV